MSIPALQQALALHRVPRGSRPGAGERLPGGMIQLIRLAAGEELATLQAQQATGESPELLREAARFYIQQVMLAPDTDSFRVLGVDRDAEDEHLKEHHRWLVRWLHPDRNPDQWEAFYADRVNRAWQDLRTPDRRRQYQSALEAEGELQAQPVSPAPPKAKPAKLVKVELEPEAEPKLGLRWLPTAIFVGLGVIAFGFIALFSALRLAGDQQPPAPAAVAEAFEPGEARVPPSAIPRPKVPPAPEPAIAAPIPELPQELSAPQAPPAAEVVDVPPAIKLAKAAAVAAPIPEPVAIVPKVEHAPPAALPPPRVAVTERNAAPAASAAPAAEPVVLPVPADSIDRRTANRMLGYFSDAYGRGDIVAMRRLFAEDVQSSRGGLREILADYDRLFESSERRSLSVHDVSWFSSGDTLTIVASYRATVSGARRERKTRGDLRFDLRKVNDEWRIYRFQHGERPG